MKICVLNSSGNVGKTTITREVIYPRLLKNTLIIEVESQNASSSGFKNINTKKFLGNTEFDEFYEFLLSEDDIIFDIGASEIANFFDNAIEYSTAINEFDYFVIPTRSNSKIMEDTAKTIKFLRSQDIDDSKIRVIFNEVETTVENQFKPLFNFDFDFNKELFLKKSNLIKDLSLLKTTFLNVYNPDLSHYRTLLKNAKTPIEKKRNLKLDLINRACTKKISEFDFLFSSAFYEFKTDLDKLEIKTDDKEKTLEKFEETEIDENDEDL